ncbi:MAG: hypothetical protein CMH18_07750 [Methylophaga sp.]|uniref:hypothetical protein n=1 Tax=Methylophaga sp. TaxID=2024840 RepID=UPI000C8E4505|nr:hypothetical protein [Methylophaga sp.]MAL49637.1 hypothetical protein [Methylophaga sp.]|tara:strand:+ start:1045 stop:1380 length:336 start_codon:yes stop_codon:yes gene_type:complete
MPRFKGVIKSVKHNGREISEIFGFFDRNEGELRRAQEQAKLDTLRALRNGFLSGRRREETIEYPKTTDVHEVDGRLYVVETWLFEFPDGEFDTLQRRHPVTDPAEIEALSL